MFHFIHFRLSGKVNPQQLARILYVYSVAVRKLNVYLFSVHNRPERDKTF